ncbi:MAG: nucleoside triphosphate pyrophosphohydrolase [bacterium]|nr:nucleoside triphosphate pyrophosphohydrolase [bacterium]
MKYPELEKLVDIIAVLRSENGCQWDREQTHSTLKTNMLEEAYEAIDAIDDGNVENLKEELGDVLLQVVLHSQIACDNNEFTIEDVAKELSQKLIHRHPHVFGNQSVSSTEEILSNWDKLKKEEKKDRKSILDGIPKSQSALMSTQKISKKVVKVGFEWENIESLKDCIKSEYKEFFEAVDMADKDCMEDEMGDILFATVNLARWYGLDAEQSLLRANKKFIKRFKKMEELADKPFEDYSFEEFNNLWKTAKTELKKEI